MDTINEQLNASIMKLIPNNLLSRLNNYITSFFLTCCLLWLLIPQVKAGAPSNGYTLISQDEFDGNAVDIAAWQFREDKRLGGLNRRENVREDSGRLWIDFYKVPIEGQESYTGGGVISRDCFGYGYYEVKGRIWGGGPGLHSSFWSMGQNGGDGTIVPKFNQIIEIDGYEIDSHAPKNINLNIHYYVGRHYSIGGVQGSTYSHDLDSSAEDFVFGYEWRPDQINWYLNGKLIRELKNIKYYGPQNVWLTALATPRGFGGGPPVTNKNVLGSSSWDYFRYYAKPLPGVNLLGNGSFEYNINKSYEEAYQRDIHYPVAWVQTGDIAAATVKQTRRAYDGDCLLRYASEQPYRVKTSQKLTGISNGLYTLTAVVRSSGGQKQAEMIASGFGKETKTTSIASQTGETWKSIEIKDISVTNNRCTIEFSTEAQGGQWLEVDRVVFAMNSQGESQLTSSPSIEESERTYLGEVVVDDSDLGKGYSEGGEWSKSSLGGYKGICRYSRDAQAWAQWTPVISRTGEYQILFHNIVTSGNLARVTMQVSHSGGVTTKELSHNGNAPEWVDLGSYTLTQGQKNFVKMMRADKSLEKEGIMRADSIRIIPVGPKNLGKSVLMKIGNNCVFVNMSQVKIDPSNPGITPFEKNGKMYVPLDFTARYLVSLTGTAENSGVASSKMTWKVDTSSGGNKALEVDGKKVVLRDPIEQVDGRVYLTASDAALCFGIYLFTDSQHGLIVFSNAKNLFEIAADKPLIDEAGAHFLNE